MVGLGGLLRDEGRGLKVSAGFGGFGVGGRVFMLVVAERHLDLVATHGFGVLGVFGNWRKSAGLEPIFDFGLVAEVGNLLPTSFVSSHFQ